MTPAPEGPGSPGWDPHGDRTPPDNRRRHLSPVARAFRSQYIAEIGSITGMKRYPSRSRTIRSASGKADGSTKVQVPTISTPASSAAQHTGAALRAFSPPRTSEYVMNPYTSPATADSEYASGARSNSVAIW